MTSDLLVEILLNPCGTLAAGAVMYIAGDRASNGKDGIRRLGAGLAGLVLIGVMLFGILRRLELLILAFGAAGFALFVVGAFWIVLSILSFLFGALASAMAEPKHEPEARVFVPSPAAPIPKADFPPPPPPPTRDELAAAAKQRYESKLQMLESANLAEAELAAAREKARQQYLRELDEVMK